MLEFAATVFVTFLVIIDPVGTLPLFVALTHRQSRERRRLTAIRSIAVAAVTLAVFAVAGQLLLHLLGITLPAFRIAGGILLLLLSIDMVFARKSGIRWTTAAETEEAEESIDVAVFPLAIPLIAGPGALTSVILLMGRAHGDLALQAIVIIGRERSRMRLQGECAKRAGQPRELQVKFLRMTVFGKELMT